MTNWFMISVLLLTGPYSAQLGEQGAGIKQTANRLTAESALVTLIEEAAVPARSSGVIEELPIPAGEMVKAGALLAQLNEDEATLAQERVTREVNVARNRAENDAKLRNAKQSEVFAKKQRQRALDALERRKDSVSDAELDALELRVFNAEREVDLAKQEQTIASETLEQKLVEKKQADLAVQLRRVFAPFAGMVVQQTQQRGEWVETGKPVVRLIRLDRLRVEAFFPNHLVDESLVGEEGILTVDLPKQPQARLTGRVSFVSPEVNPVNGQVRVWVEVANDGLVLRPGVRGVLQIPGLGRVHRDLNSE